MWKPHEYEQQGSRQTAQIEGDRQNENKSRDTPSSWGSLYDR